MSSIDFLEDDFEIACSICGNVSNKEIYPFSSELEFDRYLDSRECGDSGSLFECYVMRCPKCGYVNRSLEYKSRVTGKFLKSDSYLKFNYLNPIGEIAGRYIQLAMVNIFDKRIREAFENYLHAAWASDDENDFACAKGCRNKALGLFDILYFHLKDDEVTKFLKIKADLLRRCGRFDDVIYEYSDLNFDTGKMYYLENQQVINFQINKAKSHDNNAYKLSDALGDKLSISYFLRY